MIALHGEQKKVYSSRMLELNFFITLREWTYAMDSDLAKKPPRDLPFYQTSDKVRTSVDIIREAKNDLLHQELRSLSTRRPETPQDEGRRLFRQSSARDLSTRPPSSFRYCSSQPSVGCVVAILLNSNYIAWRNDDIRNRWTDRQPDLFYLLAYSFLLSRLPLSPSSSPSLPFPFHAPVSPSLPFP